MGSNLSKAFQKRPASATHQSDVKEAFFVRRSSTPPPIYQPEKETKITQTNDNEENANQEAVPNAEAEIEARKNDKHTCTCPRFLLSLGGDINVHTADGKVVVIQGSYLIHASRPLSLKFVYYSNEAPIKDIYLDDPVLETFGVLSIFKTLSRGREPIAPGEICKYKNYTKNISNLVLFLQKYQASKVIHNLVIIISKWLLEKQISPVVAFDIAMKISNVKLAASCMRSYPIYRWSEKDILVYPDVSPEASIWNTNCWPKEWKDRAPQDWTETLQKILDNLDTTGKSTDTPAYETIGDQFQAKSQEIRMRSSSS